VVNIFERAISGKKAAGRPQLQYLKQVALQLYRNEKNGLQQFQMESCQPIKSLKDKKKKTAETSLYRVSTLGT
jgi:hypothetical protein